MSPLDITTVPTDTDDGLRDLDIIKGESNAQESSDGDSEVSGEDEELEESEEGGEESEEEYEYEEDEEGGKGDSEEESEEGDSNSESETDSDSLAGKVNNFDKKIFKKFPELREIIKTEREFSEVFATPDEAKQAKQSAQFFANVTADIYSGKPEGVERFLSAVKGTSPQDKERFEDFAHLILPSIAKVDKDLYGAVLTVPIRRALQAAMENGLQTNNKNLVAATQWLHQFFFDTTDVAAEIVERKTKATSKELEELRNERASLEKQKLDDFVSEAVESSNHSINLQIKKALQDLTLKEYERNNIIKDIGKEIERILGEDAKYTASIKSLITQARSAGYNREWKSRIISTALARAKAALPVAKSKILKEAEISIKESKKDVRRLNPSGASDASPNGTTYDLSKVDRSQVKNLDLAILRGDRLPMKKA